MTLWMNGFEGFHVVGMYSISGLRRLSYLDHQMHELEQKNSNCLVIVNLLFLLSYHGLLMQPDAECA